VTRFSENRISHLAHLVLDGLSKSKLAEFPSDGRALNETKRVFQEFFQVEDHLDDVVRQKIMSLSRHVPQGSREWDVLYRKYYEEESRKQRR
jgi:uncharacterized protein